MSGVDDQRHAKFEETRSTLSEGLKACRAIVRSYRELMSDDSGGVHPRADNDHRDSANER